MDERRRQNATGILYRSLLTSVLIGGPSAGVRNTSGGTRMLKKLAVAALLLTVLSVGGTAQNNAASVLANASKAMGMDNLTSITFSGTAENGAFGQSKAIGTP